jgi:hypothetical protein
MTLWLKDRLSGGGARQDQCAGRYRGAAGVHLHQLAHVDNGTQAQASALDRNPDAQTARLPKPENGHTAYVGPSVGYGEPVELGTLRRAAARPFCSRRYVILRVISSGCWRRQ